MTGVGVPENVPEDVERQVERAVSGPAEDLIERLATGLGGRASASAVYGEPVHAAGVTVVPVAMVALRLGAGAGQKRKNKLDSDGGGGGGAVSAVPVGFIEITEGSAVFKPIRRTTARDLVVPLAVITGITAVRILKVILKRSGKRA